MNRRFKKIPNKGLLEVRNLNKSWCSHDWEYEGFTTFFGPLKNVKKGYRTCTECGRKELLKGFFHPITHELIREEIKIVKEGKI